MVTNGEKCTEVTECFQKNINNCRCFSENKANLTAMHPVDV